MNEHEIKKAGGEVVGKIFCERAGWIHSGEAEHYRITFAPAVVCELKLPRGWHVERVK